MRYSRYPKGVEETNIRVLKIPLTLIKPWGLNPPSRGGEDAEYKRLEASLRKYGQLTPMLVKWSGDHCYPLNGNRRLRALSRVGIPFALALPYAGRLSDAELVMTLGTTERRQGGPSIYEIMAGLPREEIVQMIDEAPSCYRRQLKGLLRVLGDGGFVWYVRLSKLGPRSYDQACRLRKYLGWSEDRLADILRWFAAMQGQGGVITVCEWAMRTGCPPGHIAKAIDNGELLQPWG